MKNLNRQNAYQPIQSLSVSYKAPVKSSVESSFLQLPDLVFIVSPSMNIKACNQLAEQFFSILAADITGKPLSSVFSISYYHTNQEEMLRELFDSGTWAGELEMTYADQTPKYFQSQFNLIYDAQGQVQSVVMIHHNVRAMARRQEDLLQAESKYRTVVESLSEGVILMNPDSSISTFNQKASDILGVPPHILKGMKVSSTEWTAYRKDGTDFPIEDFPALVSLRTGREMNDVIMGLKKPEGGEVWISINSRPIFRDNPFMPEAVVASFKDITSERLAWKKVQQSELMFRSFMENSPSLAWVYDEKGNLIYANPLFMKYIGISEKDLGRNVYDFSDSKMADKIMARSHQVKISGKPVITEDKLAMPDGQEICFLANWFLVPGKYGMMFGGQAIDITEKRTAERQLQLMNERFTYVVNASSDAIWDLDLRTNEIYRSDAFASISGYNKDTIQPSLEWWMSKIHPEDQERVARKIQEQMNNGLTNWEDEYRFLHSDGQYRFISDKGYTIFEDGMAVRQVGSMQDITERKKLEAQLLNEQVQKQKLVNQATIQAQEHERNMISAELHDNVNQLLISSRLFIGIARNTPDQMDELLEKATNYLLMAVDEIRGLSKRMNSKVVSIVGLKESIIEISNNMQKHCEMDVQLDIDEELTKQLSPQHQLMIFRIVQEQSGNIVKHAQATKATISLFHEADLVHLRINDNGKGFDMAVSKGVKGIGMINISNRVDAYNGQMSVLSAPGKGCTLSISFPVEGLSEKLASNVDQ